MYEGNVTDEIDTYRTVVKCVLATQEREEIPTFRGAVMRFMADIQEDHSWALIGDMVGVCKDLLKAVD